MKELSARKRKRSLALVAVALFSLSGYVVAVPPPPFNFGVHPFEFDPFQSKLVAAQWLNGAGCPTGATVIDFFGTPTAVTDPACPTGDPQDNNNKGLVLFKSSPSVENFAAAAAFLTFNQQGFTLTQIGYDLRKGSHCGAGAPRFNITTTTGKFYFLGCSSPAPTTTLPGNGWNRLTWGDGTAMSVMAFCVGVTCAAVQPEPIIDGIDSITIIFDEGQDAAGGPDQSGTAVLDNINVNGVRVGKP